MGDSRCVCVLYVWFLYHIEKVANSISDTSAVKINPLMPNETTVVI